MAKSLLIRQAVVLARVRGTTVPAATNLLSLYGPQRYVREVKRKGGTLPLK